MAKHNFNSETISNIMNDNFDEIGEFKYCHKNLMSRNLELIDEAKEEVLRNINKCRLAGEYTPEDIRKALRFNQCIMCSLNAFF
jgi:hypothetical protein